MDIMFVTGIEFTASSGEYKSRELESASEAFKLANVGNSRNCYKVVIYATKEGKTVEIPYRDIAHLEKSANLEKGLRAIIESKFV